MVSGDGAEWRYFLLGGVAIASTSFTNAISSLTHSPGMSRGKSPYEHGALIIDDGVHGRHFPS